MRKTYLFGVFCVSVIVVIALGGHQTTRGEEALVQPDATSTNMIPVSGTNAPAGNILPADIDPNSAFAELVQLVQAGVEESVILAYIEKSLRLFNLDADDIIYLTDIGTPPEIIKAAMEHDERLIEKGISPETAAVKTVVLEDAAEEIEEPPPEVTEDYFYDRLAPYGVWVNIDGYGRCWRPTITVYNTGWQPYCDNGHWVYTTHGWYWVSGYSWGRSTFHYGRWFRHSRHGWCWWPDTIWAPSWVCWRYDRSYCGWAPLPPHTVYRPGIGVVYRGKTITAGFDFGLNAGAFTFVETRNFCDPKPWRHRIGTGEATQIYHRTTAFHKMNYDRQHRRISNEGISHRDISTASRHEIRPVSIRQANGRIVRGSKQEHFDRGDRTRPMNRPGRGTPQETTPATKPQSPPTMRRQTPSPVTRPQKPGTVVPPNKSKPQRPAQPPAQNRRKPKPQSPPTMRRQTPSPVTRPQRPGTVVPPNKSKPQRPAQPPAQNRRKPKPQSPPTMRRQTPSPVTPPQRPGTVVPPNKSKPQRPPQNNRSHPEPKAKQSYKAKKTSPSIPPKVQAKGRVRNEEEGQ